MSRLAASPTRSDPLEFDRLVRTALRRLHEVVAEVFHFRISASVDEQSSEEAVAVIFKRRNECIVLLQRLHLSIEVINNNKLQQALHWLHSGLHWHYADLNVSHEHFIAACESAREGFTASVTVSEQLIATRIRLLSEYFRHKLINFSEPLDIIGIDDKKHANIRFTDSSSVNRADNHGDFDIIVAISNGGSNAQVMLQDCRKILWELCNTTAMKTAIADDQRKEIVFRRRHSEALTRFQIREYVSDAADLRTFLEKLFFYSFPIRHLQQAAHHQEVLPREHLHRCVKVNAGHLYTIAVLPRDRLILGAFDGSITVLDLTRPQYPQLARMNGHSGSIAALVVGSIRTGEAVDVYKRHGTRLPLLRRLFSGSWDHTIRVWDLNYFSQLVKYPQKACIEVHSDTVSALVHDDAFGRLYSGSWDRTIRIFDTNHLNNEFPQLYCLQQHTGYVRCLLLLHEGDVLLSGSNDRTVCVWYVRETNSFQDAIMVPQEQRDCTTEGENHNDSSSAHALHNSVSPDLPTFTRFIPRQQQVESRMKPRDGQRRKLKLLQGVRSLSPEKRPQNGGHLAKRLCNTDDDAEEEVTDWNPYVISILTGHTGAVHTVTAQSLSLRVTDSVAVLARYRVYSGAQDGTIRAWEIVLRDHSIDAMKEQIVDDTSTTGSSCVANMGFVICDELAVAAASTAVTVAPSSKDEHHNAVLSCRWEIQHVISYENAVQSVICRGCHLFCRTSDDPFISVRDCRDDEHSLIMKWKEQKSTGAYDMAYADEHIYSLRDDKVFVHLC